MHQCQEGAQGGGGGQEGLPWCLCHYQRLRQPVPGVLRQFHYLQATRFQGVRQGLDYE